MHQVDAAKAELVAPKLTITHQQTGDLQPFVLSDEQRIVLRALMLHRRVIVLKGRQVYCSTVCVFYALLFAMVNPSVKVALVADIREKAEGLLAKAAAWAREAGIPTKVSNTKRLVLWNGAELHAVTANSADTGTAEVKAGRSFSYGLIILSEFAYYNRDAALLASLTRSALAGARIVIESTATPAENAFRSIWEGSGSNGWHPVFLSFEQHAAYQLDERAIDDDTWEHLQATYGFKSRTHAAYWHRMVTTDMNGDVHRGLREAPVIPMHAFSFAEGRWVFNYTAAKPSKVDGRWSFYDAPDESGCIIGVDTAAGLGDDEKRIGDASAIAVIGRARGNLLATFVSREVKVPDFIGVCRAAVDRWRPHATIVETNGIGQGVYQDLATFAVARAQEQTSHESEKPVRMNLVKLSIEGGSLVAGPELEHEIKHSVMLRPKKSGKGPVWDGPDDLLNALGFALVYRRDNPWRAPVPKIDPRTHVDRRSYRKAKRKVVM